MEAAPLAVILPPASLAVQKRYESLLTVKTKAIRGKGAWYWAHLEPLLLHTTETGEAKAVKLRCTLCNSIFSASNPSRTASEHLKRGSCPNFSSSSSAATAGDVFSLTAPSSSPLPITSLAPSPHSPNNYISSRKRSSSPATPPRVATASVSDHNSKKPKGLKVMPPAELSPDQVRYAASLLYEWLYYLIGSGAISLSALEHPKFQSFLNQIGLQPIYIREIIGPRLDHRYREKVAEVDARIGDALFFQLSSNGWSSDDRNFKTGETLVTFTLNLPNGTTVFNRAMSANTTAPSEYAEEVMLNVVKDVSGRSVTRCAGIVSDRFKSKALRELERKNHWMVNTSCQLRGFSSLIKDFISDLSLFRSVATNCHKVASYFNNHSKVRNLFRKYQLQEHGNASLLAVAPTLDNSRKFAVFAMIEGILCYSSAIQMAVLDEEYKSVCFEDTSARELAEMIRDMSFWNDVDAVNSLVSLVKEMVRKLEAERPLVSRCLSLWDELSSKAKECCFRFNIDESPVLKAIERRFKKNYHPAWSAAFVLDPFYLIKDCSGNYLPPFKCLTHEQEKDVDKLITRLASPEEAHIALMELMKWRTEGLDPLYAQAVQMKELDATTGKMRIANPQSGRLVWETCLSEFKCLAKIAIRLIFLHATTSGFKCNPALVRFVSGCDRSKGSLDRAHKLVFLAAQAKLESRVFSSEEEKEAELFADTDVVHD